MGVEDLDLAQLRMLYRHTRCSLAHKPVACRNIHGLSIERVGVDSSVYDR